MVPKLGCVFLKRQSHFQIGLILCSCQRLCSPGTSETSFDIWKWVYFLSLDIVPNNLTSWIYWSMFNSFHDVRTQPLAWISCATFVWMWLEKGLVSPKQWVGTWSGVSTFPGWKESARPADLIHGLLTRKLLEGTLGNPAVCLWGLSQIVKWTGQGLKGDRRVGYCWGTVVVALKDLNPVTWPWGLSVVRTMRRKHSSEVCC